MRWIAALLLGAMAAGVAVGQTYDLVIITPHHEDIQAEFERGFAKAEGRAVKIRWIKKGTGQILQQLDAQERATPGGTFDIDVFFGGGVPDHDLAASKGYLEAPALPAAVVDGIPAEIAGVANFDPQKRWIGSALSSFGILQNQKGLKAQSLPDVTTWADLANPRMYGWVVIADPRKSASVRVAYELILQQHGWEAGWPMLMQIGANARTISDSSSQVPNEIAAGNVLAGPCIDFYAYARVAQAGADTLGYVNPAGGAAITPDPIALLRKSPRKALAEKFIAYVLSPAGQRLWVLPAGSPGGPELKALHRLPVRRDIFAELTGQTLVKDPYKEAEAGAFRKVNDALQRDRNVLLSELLGAAIVDQHAEARAAWKALIDGGMKPAAVAEWNKLPFSEADALKIAKELESGGRDAKRIIRDWTALFADKYKRVRELSR